MASATPRGSRRDSSAFDSGTPRGRRGSLIARAGADYPPRVLRALLLLLLLAPSAAAFQWSDEPEAHEVDLVVEGTLVRADARLVLAHGAIYEEVRSTIVVHRVLYRDADEPPPGSAVELHAAQQPRNPHIFHASEAYHRGMWLLSRSDVEGVYTSYRSRGRATGEWSTPRGLSPSCMLRSRATARGSNWPRVLGTPGAPSALP